MDGAGVVQADLLEHAARCVVHCHGAREDLVIPTASEPPVDQVRSHPAGPQLLITSATFLANEVLLDSMWALAGTRSRALLRASGRWGNRVTGIILISAALDIAALRKS